MTDRFRYYLNKTFGTRILSKWIVLCFDIVITVFTYGIAYILRFNFNVEDISFTAFMDNMLLTTSIFTVSFLLFQSYDGIIRHSGIADAERLIKSGIIASATCMLISLIGRTQQLGFSILPVSIIIIHVVLNISMLAFSRYVIKVLFYQSSKNKVAPVAVVIYGAGRRGVSVLNALRNDRSKNFHVAAFLDDNISKIDKTIEGVRIYPSEKFASLIKKFTVQELIIGIHTIDTIKKNIIVDICLRHDIHVKYVPPVEDWINGTLSSQQIRNINIEDLLGREPIRIENQNILKQIAGKTVLISGAAGSIGSELVRQVLGYGPKKLVLVDQAESGLFDLKMDLFFKLEQHPEIATEFIVCDITNIRRITSVFREYEPQIVFHAAAYKHVPLMETNPLEAIHVNIFGTRNLADLASVHHVEKFIMISTDKAVNPTNVMGATKRAAEIYVQEVTKRPTNKTIFITTRFGNVLGSNGSVVNYFKKQIESGGPITITHPDVTRYFMTISEACQLVLEAATMGNNSEIYLFDMGKPVRITDLATTMILLSGLKPGKDIQFTYTGLRPGEKLHEELLNNKENTVATHHDKIKIAITASPESELVLRAMQELWDGLLESDADRTVSTLKKLIPEYISMNSPYAELDGKDDPGFASVN